MEKFIEYLSLVSLAVVLGVTLFTGMVKQIDIEQQHMEHRYGR